MVPLVDVEPAHLGLAHGLCELKGGHAGEIVDEGVDQQVDLHPAEGGEVVVEVFHTFLKGRGFAGQVLKMIGSGEFLVHPVDQVGMLDQKPAVAWGKSVGHLGEVRLEVVQDGAYLLLLPDVSVELAEGLVRVAQGSDGLVGPGVGHARPWIGLVENPDPEMKNPVAGPGFLLGLEKIGDLMVDGYSLGPTGGGMPSSLNVSGVKLDTRKQAAHAPHVVVPVAPYLVVEVLEEKEPVAEGLERLGDGLELEVLALLVGPEVLRDGPIGTEHDDEALLGPGRCHGRSGLQVGHLRNQGKREGGEAKPLEGFATVQAM